MSGFALREFSSSTLEPECLDEFRQRAADRCERVRIVRISGMSFAVEMRTFPDCPSPFGIRVTHQILQDRFRFENVIEIGDKNSGGLIKILLQDLAGRDASPHHLRQDASGVIEVCSEIVGDGGLGLLDRRHWGFALQHSVPAHPTDRVAQRKCPSLPNLAFDGCRLI